MEIDIPGTVKSFWFTELIVMGMEELDVGVYGWNFYGMLCIIF